jgi:hypothetical protein
MFHAILSLYRKTIPVASQTGFLPTCRSLFDGTLSTVHVTRRLRKNWSLGRSELWYILHHLHITIYITFFKVMLYTQIPSLCHQISSLMIRTFKSFFHFLADGSGRYGTYRNVKNEMCMLQSCSACRTARVWIPRRRTAVSLFTH